MVRMQRSRYKRGACLPKEDHPMLPVRRLFHPGILSEAAGDVRLGAVFLRAGEELIGTVHLNQLPHV